MHSLPAPADGYQRMLESACTNSASFGSGTLPGQRVYLRTVRRRLAGSVGEYVYACVYTPGARTVNGHPRVEHRRLSRELVETAIKQKRDRQQRRRLKRVLRERRKGRPGRPSRFSDQDILAYFGLYRRGIRIVASKRMTLEERARRRYEFLAPEWKTIVSLQDYIMIERLVRSARKGSASRRQTWDPVQAYQQALQTVLESKTQESDDGIEQEHRRV